MTTLEKQRPIWQKSLITLLLVVFGWFCIGFADGKNTQNTLEDDLVVLSQLSHPNSPNEATASADSLEAKEQNTQKNQPAKTSNANPVNSEDLILNSPVIDEAGILTDSQKDKLNAQILQIYQDKLAQPAVVIVPTTNGVNIFDYALATAKRWQLGDKNKDDGILILIAVNDRQVYILTGYGVEGVLPDVIVKRIIRDEITPAFKEAHYAKGISNAITVIDTRLRADPETLKKADEAAEFDNQNAGTFFLFAIIFGLFFGAILTRLFGRFWGSTITSFGITLIGLTLGMGLLVSVFVAVVLWIFVLINSLVRDFGGGWSSGGGGFGGGSSGGSFGGGGSSGYSGGGGSFGGGGAGGSW